MFSDIEERSWLELHENEEVEWWCHPTIVLYLPKIVPALIVSAFLVGLSFWNPPVNIPYFAVGLLTASAVPLLYVLYLLVEWRSQYYVVTNQRVIKKYGIISRNINPANFSRISNIESRVTAFERIISFFIPNHSIGDIGIHTADDNLGDIRFESVKDTDRGLNAIQSNLSNYSSFKQGSSPTDE